MANDRMVANPAPLGLAAFGITTFLLSSANAGLWHGVGGVAVMGTALFYGGIVGLVVSIMEFIRGDAIGATFFGSFGAFWLSLWYWMSHPSIQAPGSLGVFIMCFAFGAFVFWMAVMKRSMHHNLFGFLLTLTLIFLAYGDWAGGHSGAVKTGGWLGMITAVIALYMSAKALINEEYMREILP
jgi:succinate-acetate transporter protein